MWGGGGIRGEAAKKKKQRSRGCFLLSSTQWLRFPKTIVCYCCLTVPIYSSFFCFSFIFFLSVYTSAGVPYTPASLFPSSHLSFTNFIVFSATHWTLDKLILPFHLKFRYSLPEELMGQSTVVYIQLELFIRN